MSITTSMSRPSFPERDSGIVDLSAYLGRPAQPLLPVTIAETPRRASATTRLRDAATILATVSMLLSSAALLITMRGEQGAISAASVRLPDKSAKAAPAADATDARPAEPEAPEAEAEAAAPVVDPVPASDRPEPTARPGARAPRPSRSTATPAAPAPEPDRSDRSLDELMNDAVTPALPSTPSRDEVARVLRSLSTRVAQCRPQDMEPTTVTTRVTIDGATGRVTRATVDGDLQWSTAGACIVEHLSTARFSPFARDRFEVQFPYRL